jgi:hypothetical protein
MIAFSRPFGSLLACGGALGVAVVGSLAFGSSRPPEVRLAPAVVNALPPLPSPDSLAALLVSDPHSPRSSRGTTRILLEAVAVVDWVPSGGERADLLTEIAELPDLDSDVVAAISQSAGRIPSPSARARVLRTLIRNQEEATAGARREVLDAIGTMQSTPERAVTLEMFVTTHRLSQGALLDALAQVERLRADNERSRVLVAAAGAQRIDGRARSAYTRIASAIPSERYRARALAALGRGRDSHRHRP